MTCPRSIWRLAVFVVVIAAPPLVPLAGAQFVDDFNGSSIKMDPQGRDGWAFRTGDGTATMTFQQGGEGYASVRVDATTDRRGIWWALIKHKVSERMDLQQLARPEMELRIEARIRVSHAPRRVNLHLNTQRTTDFHSHLMEFDIPDSDTWHTISMTTRDFPAVPGDTVFGQMALIDWGLEKYQVDVDHFKVDIVDVTRAGPDKGAVVPYHPPIPDPKTFRHAARAVQDAVIDLANPDVNLNNWYVQDGGVRKRVLTVNGTQYVILRFDLSSWSGRQVADHGLLELTTHSVQKTSDAVERLRPRPGRRDHGRRSCLGSKDCHGRQPATVPASRARVEHADDHRLAGYRRRWRQDLLHDLAAGVAADDRWADAGDCDQAPRVDQRIVLRARAG